MISMISQIIEQATDLPCNELINLYCLRQSTNNPVDTFASAEHTIINLIG